MQALHLTLRTSLLAIGLSFAALFAPAVQAADSAAAQYQQDVARCHNTPGIDKQACLKEAGAALEAARRDALTSPSQQAEIRNQTERCNRLPAGQREDCLKLMSDQPGTRIEGSVQGGGVLRETTITIPAPTTGS